MEAEQARREQRTALITAAQIVPRIPLGPSRLSRSPNSNALLSLWLHFFLAKLGKEELTALKELIEAGMVAPVIDRTYPLSDTPEAISSHLSFLQRKGEALPEPSYGTRSVAVAV